MLRRSAGGVLLPQSLISPMRKDALEVPQAPRDTSDLLQNRT